MSCVMCSVRGGQRRRHGRARRRVSLFASWTARIGRRVTPHRKAFIANTMAIPTSATVISITLHVASVSGTVRLKYSLNIQ